MVTASVRRANHPPENPIMIACRLVPIAGHDGVFR
jgi:hypothetical protein